MARTPSRPAGRATCRSCRRASLTVSDPPVATFSTRPSAPFASDARRFAVTTFSTYVKSRDCSPSPWTVTARPVRDRADEARHHRRVLRGRVLARAEDVEVPQRDRLDAVHAREADAEALRRELRDGVGRDRVGRLRLDAREGPAVAVHRRRRRRHDAADALVAGGEENVERALDVDGRGRQRILHRARHRAERPLVEDDLDAADRRVDALVRAQVALDDLDVTAERSEVSLGCRSRSCRARGRRRLARAGRGRGSSR